MSGREDDSAEGLFHAAKRRKIYRKKIDPDDNEEPIQEPVVERDTSPNGLTESALDFNHDQKSLPSSRWSKSHASSIQEILRHRKAVQRRRAGIEFSNQVSGTSESSTSTSLVPTTTGDEDGISPDIKSVISRFAPQAGQVLEETDKHMLAYIDSEIAKMHRPMHGHDSNTDADGSGQKISALPDSRQPAAQGKLHEVDLGPAATARNIALTEEAQRRASPSFQEEPEPVRLRRDGKPFRRKRRTSTDIKRDKLVEEVMRESRLEIYDDEAPAEEVEGDQAADDRIAEQFRKEFLDAVSQRRKKTSSAAAAGANAKDKKGAVEVARGPKLGGSRSARAKVRERELEEAKKGKR